MSTYAEIQAQIADLHKKAEALRSGELAGAKAKIHELMTEYGLTLDDLRNLNGKPKSSKAKVSVAAKYKDPNSDATWTGRGRAPLWLGGKDKEEFLIK
jgi:DNA-binding protein H-NS